MNRNRLRRLIRRHRVPVAVAAVLAALVANVAIQDGGRPLLVLALAAAGLAAVVFGLFYLSGASVTQHGRAYEKARLVEEAARRKEIQR